MIKTKKLPSVTRFVLLGLAFLISCTPATRALEPEARLRVSLSRPLRWVTSGAWTKSGDALLAPDVLAEDLLRISPQGEVSIALAKGTSATLRRPSQIRLVGGYLIEDEASRQILRLDGQLGLVGSIPAARVLDDGVELTEVYDWSLMGEGILAFGDLRRNGELWQSAFLYFDGAGRHQIFHRVPAAADVRIQYLWSMPYIATAGDVGYILFLDESRLRYRTFARQLSDHFQCSAILDVLNNLLIRVATGTRIALKVVNGRD